MATVNNLSNYIRVQTVHHRGPCCNWLSIQCKAVRPGCIRQNSLGGSNLQFNLSHCQHQASLMPHLHGMWCSQTRTRCCPYHCHKHTTAHRALTLQLHLACQKNRPDQRVTVQQPKTT